MKRLVLVDGNALLHRAYHATPPLTTSKGELVNAVYGFTSMLLKALEELHADYLAVAWDMKAPTFRHTQFEGYKSGRGPADEGLSAQYDRVHEVVAAFNIPEFKLPSFEADDLVGALAKQAEKKEKAMEIIIVTGDRDIMQLISKRIKVLMPKKTINDVGMYGEEEFVARFGFAPKNLVDYKALAGDASDNIPGVSGIGDVSATKLIQQYETVEKIYKQASLASQDKNQKIFPPRLLQLLLEGKESAQLSKKLATIETEIPIKLDLLACRVHDFDPEKVRKIFEELEFKSLIVRIPGIKNQGEDQENKTGLSTLDSGGTVHRNSEPINELTNNLSTTDLDHQVEVILQKMSQVGVAVDVKFLTKLSKDLKGKLSDIEQQIYSLIGHQINLNSPKQLSEMLFDQLHLPVIRKTKTGRSTDEETLQELKTAHPVISLLLQYRQLFKLVSTYVDALPRCVKKDGRVHSTFNVEGAATGRLSSQDPNLQNIPIRGEMGSEIRKAFIAPKNKVLLSADYSQIELRIMAHLAQDPGLKQAFKQGVDVHAATAAKIFKIGINEVSKEQRAVGKTMNFATLYGQGPHALSRQLGVDFKTAQAYIHDYFEEFPKVREWMDQVLEFARNSGYVETLWGRRRYIPELKAGDRRLVSAGERMAINMPVQGTAADMIKKAMVEIDKELVGSQFTVHSKDTKRTNKSRTNCELILQVHDELLFECTLRSVSEVGKMVKEKMENALILSVPVLVELKIGPNWGEMKPLAL